MSPLDLLDDCNLEQMLVPIRYQDHPGEELVQRHLPLIENVEHMKTQKKVRFSEIIRMEPALAYSSYSDDEIARTWYSNDEYVEIQAEAFLAIEKLAKGVDIDKDPDQCSRGIEHMIPAERRINNYRKLSIMASVLSEQDRQGPQRDPVDELDIANIYAMLSKECCQEAARRGFEDMVDALP